LYIKWLFQVQCQNCGANYCTGREWRRQKKLFLNSIIELLVKVIKPKPNGDLMEETITEKGAEKFSGIQLRFMT
jgi:hypothetical protein